MGLRALLVGASLCIATGTWADIDPPRQPGSGPGGRDYVHGWGSISYMPNGGATRAYWLFEPINPKPADAPVVVFIHGWSYTPPQEYGYWIAHLVLRGNIVIYPEYRGRFTRLSQVSANVLQAVKDAFVELQQPGHVAPDLSRFAIAGHSIGGEAAVNLADLAESEGLPRPRAVLAMAPYIANLGSLAGIPDDALVVVTEGHDDETVDPDDPRLIWSRLGHVPRENRDFIHYFSDDHGTPDIVTDHGFPRGMWKSPDTVNALEFYGVWKIFDGLMNAAFYGVDREYALGNTPEQRWMGKWSDGTPVIQPIVADDP